MSTKPKEPTPEEDYRSHPAELRQLEKDRRWNAYQRIYRQLDEAREQGRLLDVVCGAINGD